jgi:hypothetical protein
MYQCRKPMHAFWMKLLVQYSLTGFWDVALCSLKTHYLRGAYCLYNLIDDRGSHFQEFNGVTLTSIYTVFVHMLLCFLEFIWEQTSLSLIRKELSPTTDKGCAEYFNELLNMWKRKLLSNNAVSSMNFYIVLHIINTKIMYCAIAYM